MEDATYYMAIHDPREFRRELLSSSKSMIQLLQRFDELRRIREAKVEKMYQLSKTMQEIAMLAGKLRRVLPKTKASSMPKQPAPRFEQEEQRLPKPSHHHYHSEPDVSHLKRQLDEIEQKLGNL